MRPAVSAELLADFSPSITTTTGVVGEGSGRVEGAADGSVRFVGEKRLRATVVPGEGDAEPGCEGGGLGAALERVC